MVMKGDLFIGDKIIGTVTDFKFESETFDTVWKATDFPIDFTAFGKSQTYTTEFTIPSIFPPLPPVKVEGRKVNPKDVGVNIPGLKWIGLDVCPAEERHKADYPFSGIGVLGHAHICPKDPDKDMICTREEWLFNADGTYSDILLHEVAHLMTNYGIIDSMKCETFDTHSMSINGTPEKTQWFDWHGEEWEKMAIKLGARPSRFGAPPIKNLDISHLSLLK